MNLSSLFVAARRRKTAAVALMIFAAPAAAAAQSPSPNAPLPAVILHSEKPFGDPDVDQFRVVYFPAASSAPSDKPVRQPAIVLIPSLGSDETEKRIRTFAAYLAARGIGVALIGLPFNGPRWPKTENRGHTNPNLHYASGDPARNAQAFAQAESDVSTAATWLARQPGVDPARLGVGGISLGAIVAHGAMGADSRLGVGVAMLGGGDLADLYQHSIFSRLTRLLHPSTRPQIAWDVAVKTLSYPDPLTTANNNRPRRVFMVDAARDIVIPPRDSTKLWNALGRPPIRWLDSNHYGLAFNNRGARSAAWQYYRSAWGLDGATPDATLTPALSTLTIKIGFVSQFGHDANTLGAVAPALTWQALSLGHRPDHIAVVHADLGITTRGPFVAAAATVTPFIDAGFASRLGRTVDAPRPYIGVHVAF